MAFVTLTLYHLALHKPSLKTCISLFLPLIATSIWKAESYLSLVVGSYLVSRAQKGVLLFGWANLAGLSCNRVHRSKVHTEPRPPTETSLAGWRLRTTSVLSPLTWDSGPFLLFLHQPSCSYLYSSYTFSSLNIFLIALAGLSPEGKVPVF